MIQEETSDAERDGTMSWLAAMTERVFAATGCKLRLERKTSDSKENAVVDARAVGLEWANDLSVRSEGVSAHEAMEAANGLRELFEELLE